MESLLPVLGRFHPMVVHLPIGMLLLSFFFECLSLLRRFRDLRGAVQPSLVIGSFFAVVSVATGLVLATEGGYDQELLQEHKSLGIGTTVLAMLMPFIRRGVLAMRVNPRWQRTLCALLFLPLIVLLSATGHWGGSLTHGDDYLTAGLHQDTGKNPLATVALITDAGEAMLYEDVVRPILESRCYGCHGERKQKGRLRLDSKEWLLRGGKHGAVLEEGPADSSELYHRLVLPIDHDEHMPPRERDQLSLAEIDIIKAWIDGGAPFSTPVSRFDDSRRIAMLIKSLQHSGSASIFPEKKIAPLNTTALSTVTSTGAIALPISAGSAYLTVSFVNNKEPAIDDLMVLTGFRDHIVALDLSDATLTDEHLVAVSQLVNLRVLDLSGTNVGDDAVTRLVSLKEIRHLNLSGTAVSDRGLSHLSQLGSLEKLYLFGTSVSRTAVSSLLAGSKKISIDTGGYTLPSLSTDTIVFKRKS